MWFKCGADIINCSIMRELGARYTTKDNCGRWRKYTFILLLSETAEDRADDLQDAADLARLVDTTPRQAQIVWDVCIKHNVLRRGPHGYSAKAWMIERGILGDTRKWRPDSGGGGSGNHNNAEPKNDFTGQWR